jgi:carbamate kinase
MRLVVALGGNALLERGEKPDAEIQEHHIAQAVDALAPLCRDHDVVITHGNGPQVGLLALESGADPALSHAYPLDSLGAQTQGMIGYWLAQALDNAVAERTFVALICQTVVDRNDTAFANPSKFVGQFYSAAEAASLANKWGWSIKPDGEGWRRVVPSPRPQEIVELPVLETLLSNGAGVICCGGGGIPVVRGWDGALRGAEAVIDKDWTASLLARLLGADVLLVLTDVEAVELDYGTPDARPLRCATSAELSGLSFPDGSMGPKVEAACDFVNATGGRAAIGRLVQAGAILDGEAGTTVTRG